MTEEQCDHSDGQQFAQAVARLAGNADSGEQNHGVEGEDEHTAQETFLLGNHRENEVVMGDDGWQVTERNLLALPPPFTPEAPEPTEISACRTFQESLRSCSRAVWRSVWVVLSAAKSRPK